jgi:RND family efflux transporter MFP subunit
MTHEETTIDLSRELGFFNRMYSEEFPVMWRHPTHRVVWRVRKSRFRSVGWLLLGAVLLSACAEEPPPPVETIRAVRTSTVLEPASGRSRRFSGIVEAADTSSISFEVTGIVQSMEVDVGDRVENGQLLAVVDDSAYRLNIEAATAEVKRARVEFNDAQNAYDRYRTMLESSGAISERAVELAEANRSSAQGSLAYAESRLRMAERDLARTRLSAPFDGVVAQRHVEAFQQVATGQKVLDLFMEGAMEAALSVPESEIRFVHIGLPASIRFPALGSETFEGIVGEVSEVAGAANAFPVRVVVNSDNPGIRPGVTAEVTLMLGNEVGERSYLIPISAIGGLPDGSSDFVFRYNPESSTVSRVLVNSASAVRDDYIAVSEGVTVGDVIVTAGVSFLRDGQQVRLMESSP